MAIPAPGMSQNTALSLRLVVLDDRAQPVAGTVIEVNDLATGASVLAHTDREGATPLLELVAESALGAYLAETPTARGTALGQYFDLDSTPAGDSDELVSHQVLFQPLLESRVVSYAQTTLPADHSRWRLVPSEGAKASSPDFSFSAQIGQLLTQREIQAYAAYYGVDFGAAGATARVGVVIRSAAVDIGEQNLCLVVDARGHGFSTQPVANVFAVKGDVTTPGLGTLEATVFALDADHVFLQLSGALERADNVILLSPTGPPHPPQQLESAPPQLGSAAPPPTSPMSGGPACPGGVSEPACQPIADPSNACQPPAPSSDPGCPTATPLTSYPACSANSYGGLRHCDTSGSVRIGLTATVTGSVSGGFKVTVGVAEFSAGATGSVAAGTSYHVQTNLGPGDSGCAGCNGGADECGQCKRLCLDVASCKSEYTVTKDDYKYDFITGGDMTIPIKTKLPCALTQKTTAHCLMIVGTNVAVCNRSCP